MEFETFKFSLNIIFRTTALTDYQKLFVDFFTAISRIFTIYEYFIYPLKPSSQSSLPAIKGTMEPIPRGIHIRREGGGAFWVIFFALTDIQKELKLKIENPKIKNQS